MYFGGGKSEHHRAGWSSKATDPCVTTDKGKCHRNYSFPALGRNKGEKSAVINADSAEVIPRNGKPHLVQGCVGEWNYPSARCTIPATARARCYIGPR
jgi:hypothetical protein